MLSKQTVTFRIDDVTLQQLDELVKLYTDRLPEGMGASRTQVIVAAIKRMHQEEKEK